MFSHIMVPVDLHMPPEVSKALSVTAEIAKWQGAKVSLVSVTGYDVTEPHHTLDSIRDELATLAGRLHDAGVADVETFNVTSLGGGADVDSKLVQAAEQVGADLVVIGTHAPRLTDHVFSSHAGHLTKHAKMSVLAVR